MPSVHIPRPDFALSPGRDQRDTVIHTRWNGITPHLVLALLIAPLAVTLLSYIATLAIGGPIAANPVRTIAAAVSRLVVPGLRANSWDPMLHAMALAQQQGASVYNTIFFDLHEKFQYPLTSLLWLDGLGALIHVNAETLNRINAAVFAVNAAGCVLVLRHSAVNRNAAQRIHVDWPLAAGTFALAYAFWPTLYGLYVGQIQVWINLLFTGALILWLRGGRLSAEILIGLASTIKPQLGLLLVWAVLWRERNFAIGVAATALLANALAILRYGLANNLNYLDVISFLSHHGESFHPNQSVNGMLNRLFFLGNNTEWAGDQFPPYNTTVYLVTVLSSLVFVAIPLIPALRARGERAGVLDLALGGLCCTMASPIVWEHHYGITLPIYVLLFAIVLQERPDKRRWRLLVCLWTSWLLVGTNLQVFDGLSRTHLNFLQSPVFFGALILLVVLCMLSSEMRPLTSGQGLRPARARQV